MRYTSTMAARDEVETLAHCPSCITCPVCNARGLVSREKRDGWKNKRVACPKCATKFPSEQCNVCEGRGHVPEGVRALWEALYGQKGNR